MILFGYISLHALLGFYVKVEPIAAGSSLWKWKNWILAAAACVMASLLGWQAGLLEGRLARQAGWLVG